MSSSSSANSANTTTKPTMTEHEFVKSWGGIYYFTLLYGLKMHDEEAY